jgi:hypothetical protein
MRCVVSQPNGVQPTCSKDRATTVMKWPEALRTVVITKTITR